MAGGNLYGRIEEHGPGTAFLNSQEKTLSALTNKVQQCTNKGGTTSFRPLTKAFLFDRRLRVCVRIVITKKASIISQQR